MSGPRRCSSSEMAWSRALLKSVFRPAMGSAPNRPSGAVSQSMIFSIESALGRKTPRASSGTDELPDSGPHGFLPGDIDRGGDRILDRARSSMSPAARRLAALSLRAAPIPGAWAPGFGLAVRARPAGDASCRPSSIAGPNQALPRSGQTGTGRSTETRPSAGSRAGRLS